MKKMEHLTTGRYPFLNGMVEISCIGVEGESKVRFVICRPYPWDGKEGERTWLSDLVHDQLHEYEMGSRREFDLPVVLKGTPFQETVWEALKTIPYGETRTYAEIARMIGRPNAGRAVGMANNRNPLNIIIPCHRVIGASGRVMGYSGGVQMKRELLDLEYYNRGELADGEEEPSLD